MIAHRDAVGGTTESWVARAVAELRAKEWLQGALIVVAGVFISFPCLVHGIVPGYNAPSHVRYYHHFSLQFWDGDPYPRWLAAENKGYGSPIFIAQYPLPYFLTALLRPLLSFSANTREARELGIFTVLALCVAGLATWRWTRRFVGPLSATGAAIVFMALPYIVQDGVYVRDAIGELCTFIWIPLALSCAESLREPKRPWLMGFAVALCFTSNLLSTALFLPVLVGYVFLAERSSTLPPAARAYRVALALALGTGLAAIYLAPAVAHRHLFDLRQNDAFRPGYQFGLYFLETTRADFRHRYILLGVAATVASLPPVMWYVWRSSRTLVAKVVPAALLAMLLLALVPSLGYAVVRASGLPLRPAPESDFSATMLVDFMVMASLAFLARCRTADDDSRARFFFWTAAASLFLMLPFSGPIWRAVPGSTSIQFPFRLGGVMSISVTGLIALAFESYATETSTAALERGPSLRVLTLAAVFVVAVGAIVSRMDRSFRHPQTIAFDASQDVDAMYRAYVPAESIHAFAANLGTIPESYEVKAMPGDGTLRAHADGCNAKADREGPRRIVVATDCPQDTSVGIGQLYLPLWALNGEDGAARGPVLGAARDGTMELQMPAGHQRVAVNFSLGTSERLGLVLTIVSCIAGLVGLLGSRMGARAGQGRTA